jgi:N6-L-threonylcarbamoyladenine synthase
LAGGEDAGKVAYFALDFVAKNVIALAENARAEKPELPIIFAGGVMRNKIIRNKITQKLSRVLFADVELSSDNAVGTAYLGLEKLTGGRN